MGNIKSPEFWVNFPDRDDYMVSNTGRVKSYHRQWKRWVEKTSRVDVKGYETVGVSPPQSKETNSVRIHRIVASAFIPNPNNLPYVNHKDNNPKNNDASNLEWCDPKYNMEYSFFSGERVSGQSKPVRLYVDGRFFSDYSSIEHCSMSVSNNKKFFKLTEGRMVYFDGLFRLELIKKSELMSGEFLNRRVLKNLLGRTSSKPVIYDNIPYYSMKELSLELGISYGRVRQACADGGQLLGKPIRRISIPEYIRESNLIIEMETIL